jgi:hypothetical protein
VSCRISGPNDSRTFLTVRSEHLPDAARTHALDSCSGHTDGQAAWTPPFSRLRPSSRPMAHFPKTEKLLGLFTHNPVLLIKNFPVFTDSLLSRGCHGDFLSSVVSCPWLRESGGELTARRYWLWWITCKGVSCIGAGVLKPDFRTGWALHLQRTPTFLIVLVCGSCRTCVRVRTSSSTETGEARSNLCARAVAQICGQIRQTR